MKKLFRFASALVASFFLFTVAAPAVVSAQVVVNEFMADPVTISDTNGEWVELVNTGTSPVDVNGWTISGGTITAGSPIPAGGKIVICRNSTSGVNGGVTCGGSASFSLVNGGGTISLVDDTAVTVDTFTYTNADVETGQSTEVIQTGSGTKQFNPNSTDTYGATSNTGTPNSANSQPDNTVRNERTTVVYASIQAAINAAEAGDTLSVAPGTYSEVLTVNKALTLLGANAGVNPLSGVRGAETVLSAPGNTAINALVPNITIDGFSIDGAMGIDTQSGTSTSGLTIQNNIITGTNRAVSLHSPAAATGTSILNNDLVSNTRSLHVSGDSFTDLKVNGNRFSGSAASTGVQFLGPGVPINGLEFKDNEVLHTANIGSNITNGTVSGNTFDVAAPGVLGLQINLHDSVLSNNTFNGNETAACFQLFGSQFGLVPSSNVTISDNTFTDCGNTVAPWNYAIQLSQEVEDITITGNTITNAYEGINTRIGDGWDFTGKNIQIYDNSITGSRSIGAKNTVSGTMDVSKNWWGDADPDFSGVVSGDVNYAPWCDQSDCSGYFSDEPITLPVSGNQATISGGDLTLEGTTSEGTVTAVIPEGTTITATGGTWDGTLNPPTTKAVVIPETDGFTTTFGIGISIGSDDVTLSFDKSVRLLLPGQAGKSVGFIQPGGVFTKIAAVCDGDTQAQADAQLLPSGECSIDQGADLIIWTTHFTDFATYTLTAIPPTGGLGSGSAAPNAAVGFFSSTSQFGQSAASTAGESANSDVEAATTTQPQTSTATTGSTNSDAAPKSSEGPLGIAWPWWILINLALFSAIYFYVRRLQAEKE